MPLAEVLSSKRPLTGTMEETGNTVHRNITIWGKRRGRKWKSSGGGIEESQRKKEENPM